MKTIEGSTLQNLILIAHSFVDINFFADSYRNKLYVKQIVIDFILRILNWNLFTM